MDESVVEELEKQQSARYTPWRKLMLDAADYIERYGLNQDGEMTDGGQRYCTIGTLRYLATGDALGQFKDTPAYDAWFVLRPLVGGTVGSWSDRTPPKEVVATLRRVATGGL